MEVVTIHKAELKNLIGESVKDALKEYREELLDDMHCLGVEEMTQEEERELDEIREENDFIEV